MSFWKKYLLFIVPFTCGEIYSWIRFNFNPERKPLEWHQDLCLIIICFVCFISIEFIVGPIKFKKKKEKKDGTENN